MSASSCALLRTVFAVLAALGVVSTAHAVGPWTVETVDAFGLNPRLVLDANGSPSIGYSLMREPKIAIRSGTGWTYQTLTTPDNSARPQNEAQIIYTCSPWLDIDPTSGQFRLAWLQNWDSDLWYAQPEAGGGWSYQLIDGSGGAPSLAVDPTGQVQMLQGPNYGVHAGSGWSFQPAGFTGTLRLDSQGRTHALFWTGNYQNYDLGYARLTPSGWVTETIVTAGNTGYSDLALDGAGVPHVVFFDEVTQLVHHGVRMASGWNFETVAGPVGHTSFVSLALGAGGEPFISYWHLDQLAQYFARRGGGVWTSELIEDEGSAGGESSMAIDAAGRPHVAYTDYYQNRLRYSVRSSAVTGVEPRAALRFGLASVAPNPARSGGALDLALHLDAPLTITLELLDLAGRRVASREPIALSAGTQHVRWAPRVAPGGLYFLAVRSDRGERVTTRLALLP